jgi:hypothetical protein
MIETLCFPIDRGVNTHIWHYKIDGAGRSFFDKGKLREKNYIYKGPENEKRKGDVFAVNRLLLFNTSHGAVA